MQATLIYNPQAGQVVVRRELEDAVAFLNHHGWTVVWKETTKPAEATQMARHAVRRGAKVIIAAGGDGTVSDIANGLFGTDAALGVFPVGTTNSWALQIGIPALNPLMPGKNIAKLVADVEKRIAHPLPANYYRRVLLNAAKVLVEGHTVLVDLGEVADHYFLMWAGIGLDAAIVESVSLKEKQVLGSWAYLLNTLRKVGQYSTTRVRLNLDGKTIVTNTPLIIVSNIQLYGGIVAIGANAKVNDAKLDVCVFKGEGFFTFVQHALKVLSHRHIRDAKLEYYQCSEIVVEADCALPLHLDGEPFTKTPITIHTVPSALKVIVPKKVPGNLFICDPCFC